MSLFSGITNFLTNNPVGKVITNTLNTISGIVTNPVTAITQGTAASTQKFINSTPLQNTVKTVTNVGLAAVATVGAGAIAEGGITTIGNAVKAIIPATTKGKIIGAIAAPIAIGAFTSAPAKTTQAILEAPSNFANFGQNLGVLVQHPSIATAENLAKENPVITTVAAIGAGAAAIGGLGSLANVISNYTNTKATKANTQATLENSASSEPQVFSTLPLANSTPQNQVLAPSPAVVAAQKPAPAGQSTKKKKKNKAKKKTTKKKKTRRSKKKAKKKTIKRRKYTK